MKGNGEVRVVFVVSVFLKVDVILRRNTDHIHCLYMHLDLLAKRCSPQLMCASAILEPIQLNATLQQATVFNAALGMPLQCSYADGRLQKETHEGHDGTRLRS